VTARVAVVVFPGTNCERDCERALNELGAATKLVWHSDKELPDADCVVLPGGFAHGDYLRTGAIARFSPIMEAVAAHAERGGLVLGICNGFQILCEAGLLPGALRKNSGLKFLCTWTDVRVDNAETPFTSIAAPGDVLRIPINHFEGNWYCEPAGSHFVTSPTPTDRSTTSPACSTPEVTCWGSCPIPSAPARLSSAPSRAP
jgi:phosphoribosylformylglycinamidine synthase subunit PurQ / glutaminase